MGGGTLIKISTQLFRRKINRSNHFFIIWLFLVKLVKVVISNFFWSVWSLPILIVIQYLHFELIFLFFLDMRNEKKRKLKKQTSNCFKCHTKKINWKKQVPFLSYSTFNWPRMKSKIANLVQKLCSGTFFFIKN